VQPVRLGFTLIEVIITLSVMILLAGLAVPTMTRYMDELPLKTTAKDLRGTFFGLRRDAMTSAEPVRFRIESKSNKYVVVRPSQKNATVTELDDKLTLQETNWTGAEQPVESISAEWLSGDPKAQEHASIGWSSGVTFLPNGGCDHDYEALLVTEDKRHIKIFVRALTGAMSMSEILREELE
jgi:hypothetical protein